jgi:glycolate oxidase
LKSQALEEFRQIAGPENLPAAPEETLASECDGFAFHRHRPDAVLLLSRQEQIGQAVRTAVRYRVPLVPRGAGTGLSGGALPRFGEVILSLARMKRILQLDYDNRQAVVEPGVINLELSKASAPEGYYFAPDPSSQMVSTVGGNLAENAGGPHCFKYGMTSNHIVALVVVLPDGETVELGSRAADCPGYVLVGVFAGSEGTFGVATQAVLKLSRLPKAVKTLAVSAIKEI